jgi:tripartite-type tricarboxylate transporter receptor subunit TctC
MTIMRTLVVLAVCGLTPAAAQTYPNHPIRIIVPTVAGGTVDVITRIVANALTGPLGGSVVVDNRSGAGNTLGSREAARADADGYTLLMTSASGHVISPLVYKSVDYDPIKSFAPIALIAEGASVFVVNPALPYYSLQDVVAAAKAKPGKLNYSSAGVGTLPHLTGELLKSLAGIDLVHVPSRGGAPATADVIGGSIDMTVDAIAPLLQHIKQGRLRALAVTSPHRIADLPDVPTMAESGYPAVLATAWTGLFAPAGTDAAVLAKLNAAVNEGLASVPVRTALARVANEPRGGSPQALTDKVVSEHARWAPIVRSLNLKAD